MSRHRRSERPARARRVARLLHGLGESAADAARHGRRLAPSVPDGPRGERMAILDHRERMPGGGDRGREAWVLRVVLGWSPRDAARALDCSKTALDVHQRANEGRFDQDDVAALRRGMAAIDAEGDGGSGGVGSFPRIGAPWRWLVAGTMGLLGLDLLVRWLASAGG